VEFILDWQSLGQVYIMRVAMGTRNEQRALLRTAGTTTSTTDLF
jgi:hypothetical protein